MFEYPGRIRQGMSRHRHLLRLTFMGGQVESRSKALTTAVLARSEWERSRIVDSLCVCDAHCWCVHEVRTNQKFVRTCVLRVLSCIIFVSDPWYPLPLSIPCTLPYKKSQTFQIFVGTFLAFLREQTGVVAVLKHCCWSLDLSYIRGCSSNVSQN